MAEKIIEEEIIEEPIPEELSFKDRLQKGLVDYGLPTAQAIGKGLDYLGGVARTGAAGLGELATGKDLYREGELLKALKAEPVSGSELLERAGVEQMGSLSDIAPGMFSETGEGLALQKGGPLDVTGRGAAGFALETATDPLSYLSLGTVPLAKRLIGGAGKAQQGLGKSIFKSGLKRADEVSAAYGKTPLSDVLMKYGIKGSNRSIQKQTSSLVNDLMTKRNALMEAANATGATPDIQRALAPAREMAEKMARSRDEDMAEVGRTFLEQIKRKESLAGTPDQVLTKRVQTGVDEYLQPKFETITEVVPGQKPANLFDIEETKSFLYEGVGSEAYNKIKDAPTAKEFQKQLARGFKEEIERTADEAVEGSGQAIKQLNEEIGSILTDKKVINQEALKDVNKNLFTAVDALALAAGGPGVAAGKKLADILKMTGTRTRAGSALMKTGKGVEAIGAGVGKLERVAGRPGEILGRRAAISSVRPGAPQEEIIEEEVVEE